MLGDAMSRSRAGTGPGSRRGTWRDRPASSSSEFDVFLAEHVHEIFTRTYLVLVDNDGARHGYRGRNNG